MTKSKRSKPLPAIRGLSGPNSCCELYDGAHLPTCTDAPRYTIAHRPPREPPQRVDSELAAEAAPLDVDALPDYWDARRVRLGKPDKSTCAAELRRALAHRPEHASLERELAELREAARALDRARRGVLDLTPASEGTTRAYAKTRLAQAVSDVVALLPAASEPAKGAHRSEQAAPPADTKCVCPCAPCICKANVPDSFFAAPPADDVRHEAELAYRRKADANGWARKFGADEAVQAPADDVRARVMTYLQQAAELERRARELRKARNGLRSDCVDCVHLRELLLKVDALAELLGTEEA